MPMKNNFIFTKITNEDIVHTEEHESSSAPLWHQALADRRRTGTRWSRCHSRLPRAMRCQAPALPGERCVWHRAGL